MCAICTQQTQVVQGIKKECFPEPRLIYKSISALQITMFVISETKSQSGFWLIIIITIHFMCMFC